MKWLSTLLERGSQIRRMEDHLRREAEGGDEALGNIETGMEMEERSVLWKINNFPVIQKKDSLINSQRLKFSAGVTIGQPSRWKVYLKAEKDKDGKKWIGIYFKVVDPFPGTPYVHLYSQMSFAIKDPAGVTTWSGQSDLFGIFEFIRGGTYWRSHEVVGWGFRNMIDVAGSAPPETLEIHLTMTLYSPARKPQATVPSTLAKFHEKAADKARKDLGRLVKQNPGGDVKIVSGDGKEFLVPIGILSARSPVFEAMLRTNMTEAISGRIHLPDISGKGLKVLLHFIYTGELSRKWKKGGVIVELTNAAAKYQFSDLLGFLDMTLGKVCNVKNVGPLLTLANQLSLKTAQKELLKFVQDNGASTVEKFSEIMKVISVTAMESVTK